MAVKNNLLGVSLVGKAGSLVNSLVNVLCKITTVSVFMVLCRKRQERRLPVDLDVPVDRRGNA